MSGYKLGIVLDGEYASLPIIQQLPPQLIPLPNHKSVDVRIGLINDVRVAFTFRYANEFCEDALSTLKFLGCENILLVYYLYDLECL